MLQYVPLQPEAACLLHSISSFACLISRAHRLRDNSAHRVGETSRLSTEGREAPQFCQLVEGSLN